jgi:hypothetical protein
MGRDESQMIKIKNLRNSKPSEPWDVKVDRSSILGNPYLMLNESERESVCAKYEKWFLDIVTSETTNEKRKEFKAELQRLRTIYKKYGKLNLFCWCAPKKCHAETIRQWVNGSSCNNSSRTERN